jgi:hypothetical protein
MSETGQMPELVRDQGRIAAHGFGLSDLTML